MMVEQIQLALKAAPCEYFHCLTGFSGAIPMYKCLPGSFSECCDLNPVTHRLSYQLQLPRSCSGLVLPWLPSNPGA